MYIFTCISNVNINLPTGKKQQQQFKGIRRLQTVPTTLRDLQHPEGNYELGVEAYLSPNTPTIAFITPDGARVCFLCFPTENLWVSGDKNVRFLNVCLLINAFFLAGL